MCEDLRIRKLKTEEVQLFKELRLKALQEAANAFDQVHF